MSEHRYIYICLNLHGGILVLISFGVGIPRALLLSVGLVLFLCLPLEQKQLAGVGHLHTERTRAGTPA